MDDKIILDVDNALKFCGLLELHDDTTSRYDWFSVLIKAIDNAYLDKLNFIEIIPDPYIQSCIEMNLDGLTREIPKLKNLKFSDWNKFTKEVVEGLTW